MNKKQWMNFRVLQLAHELHKLTLDPELADTLTLEDTKNHFPKVSYFRQNNTGQIRVGMSLRGIRKMVKRFPGVTSEALAVLYNIKAPNG